MAELVGPYGGVSGSCVAILRLSCAKEFKTRIIACLKRLLSFILFTLPAPLSRRHSNQPTSFREKSPSSKVDSFQLRLEIPLTVMEPPFISVSVTCCQPAGCTYQILAVAFLVYSSCVGVKVGFSR